MYNIRCKNIFLYKCRINCTPYKFAVIKGRITFSLVRASQMQIAFRSKIMSFGVLVLNAECRDMARL